MTCHNFRSFFVVFYYVFLCIRNLQLIWPSRFWMGQLCDQVEKFLCPFPVLNLSRKVIFVCGPRCLCFWLLDILRKSSDFLVQCCLLIIYDMQLVCLLDTRLTSAFIEDCCVALMSCNYIFSR